MKSRYALFALLVATLALASGCGCPRKLDGFNKELNALYAAKTQAASANQSASDTEAKLAGLAASAQQEARQCPELAPSFYRVAAVAAWQADGAGAALVNPISAEGAAVCDGLSAKDNTAPRDCTLIRIAAPMALQDELTAKQLAFRRKAEQSGNDTLPASDLAPLKNLLAGYHTASQQLDAVRAGAAKLDSPETLLKQTDRERVIVYCNALETLGLMGKVEGMTMPLLATERPPLDAITASLGTDGIGVSGPNTCKVPVPQDASFLTSP